MAVDNNQEEISEMLQLLANMLRYTLSQENELVSLDKDMHWIKAYSKIIRLRFGDNIDFDFSGIDDRLYDTDVPVLLFQPFIENSVLHGINGYVEKGEIKIRGYIDKDVRIFEVEDNGKGITEEEKEALWEKNPLHLGIRNVDIRIKLIYGDNWGVSISSENQKTIVKICMPL